MEIKKIRTALLISGAGTTAQAIIAATRDGRLPGIDPVVVVASSSKAAGLVKMRALGVSALVVDPKSADFAEKLLLTLTDYKVELVSQNGWLPKTPVAIIRAFPNRIVNQHPAPLDPAGAVDFGGQGMYGLRALAARLLYVWITRSYPWTESVVHYVTEEYDRGSLVRAEKFSLPLPDSPLKLEQFKNDPLLQQKLWETAEKIYPPFFLTEYANVIAALKLVSETDYPVYKRSVRLIPAHHTDLVKEIKELIIALDKRKTLPTQKKLQKILIIGAGGREHAIGWKLSQGPLKPILYFAPGNGGTATLGTNIPIGVTETEKLVQFARKEKIDLTVVGPEAVLASGIVDIFASFGLAIFGPTKNASQLETSKAWACEFMQHYKIPQPKFHIFTRIKNAVHFIKNQDWRRDQWVIKANGLAAGKGVFIPKTKKEALRVLRAIMVEKKFGDAGTQVVLQERLVGEEVSVLGFCDGKDFKLMVRARDYKRVGDADTGLNTGGMGGVAPIELPPEMLTFIETQVFAKVLSGMQKEDIPYKGILYVGLMVTETGPRVLEFNCRFGDPETQVILPLLKSDLAAIFQACISGSLNQIPVEFLDQKAVCVILASKGYPQEYDVGKEIMGLEEKNDVLTFHSGTAKKGKKIVSAGGRVLGVVGVGKTFAEAQSHAYAQIGPTRIHFSDMHYRGDIGISFVQKERVAQAFRIEVLPIVIDPRAGIRLSQIREFSQVIKNVWVADVYTIDKTFSREERDQIETMLVNPVSEKVAKSNGVSPYPQADWVIEIGFLPGVTDNVAATVRENIADLVGKPFTASEGVYSSQLTFIAGHVPGPIVKKIALRLANPLIQRIHIYRFTEFLAHKETIVPRVQLASMTPVMSVDLHVSDAELTTIGKEGITGADHIRRGPLSLSLPYLQAIRAYFDTQERDPTDVELESIAQTWSEHCKHTIFNDPLDDVSEGLFTRYIKRATEIIRKKKGADDFCASVFTDNSGAVIFDNQYLITHKVETHNSPSALDPFGGAITGIVGVNRDALGFGLGAKPILNQYGFCFAPLTDKKEFFRDQNLTQPVLSGTRIMEGVIAGVNGGGNCSGIPTDLGFMYFDERFRAKPLVFVGTLGLTPRMSSGQDVTHKKARAGDYIVMVGGRVGIDGIHGATFSSEALNVGSPATAVQIGDPITQKKLSDVLIREARDGGLYTSITDNGAGGLSCSVAEMAKESGGAEVKLETVPLKYPGLMPWQIWISESQERMTLSVPPQKWPQLQELLASRGVEATVIGKFTDSGFCRVSYHGESVLDIAMEFLHNGLPQVPRHASYPFVYHPEPDIPLTAHHDQVLLELLQSPNLTSFEFVTQQYDHEVQGTSVLKPVVGKGKVNADAAVIAPVYGSERGVVLSQALYPSFSDIDAYHMAAASIDTAVRQVVAAGADPAKISLLDNFCWPSGGDPERLGQLRRACEACFDVATAYGTPFISGKDSMFNDFSGFDTGGQAVKISVPPTLLITTVAVMDDVHKAITPDFKVAGDWLYILGETQLELGGSEYFNWWQKQNGSSAAGGTVPHTNTALNLQLYRRLHAAIERGLIASCNSVGRGGVGIALTKASIAGQLGIEINLEKLPGKTMRPDEALFSESQGRFVVSVAPNKQAEFEQLFVDLPLAHIGTVTKAPKLVFKTDTQVVVDVPLAEVTRAYRSTFAPNPEREQMHISPVKPRVLVLSGYGLNCEEETAFAFKLAGAEAQIIHVNDLITQKYTLADFDIMAIPGGFAYGDDTGSGKAFAQKLKNHLWQELLDFVSADKLLIGICNGFQILVALGLLPAVEEKYGQRQVALIHNDNATYTARWVDLEIKSESPWFSGLASLSLPIAHGEGKFYANEQTLATLENNGQVAARYAVGEMAALYELAANPNGSLENIAAVTNRAGNILGIMPHPERAILFTQLPHWTLLKEQYQRNGLPIPTFGPGLTLFKNAVEYVKHKAQMQKMGVSGAVTYSESGVDISLGDTASKILYQAARATWKNRNGLLGEVIEPTADFSGIRAIDVSKLPEGMLMNINFDGVGTKIEIAERMNKHTTVAYDLLAMVCDDAAVRGGEPVVAGSILDVSTLKSAFALESIRQIADGYTKAANDAGISIINGELAELGKRVQGYGDFNYNWGATVVWFAQKERLLTGKNIRVGDTLIGFAESGLRSNGFSLIRKIFSERFGPNWHNELYKGKRLGDWVLTPSTIYSRLLVALHGGFAGEPKAVLTGAVHVTGGGIPGKLGRLLGVSGLGAIIDNPLPPSPIILWAQEQGGVVDPEAYQAWNMGQGLIVVTPSPARVLEVAREFGISAEIIGKIVGSPGIFIKSHGFFDNGKNLAFNVPIKSTKTAQHFA